MGREYDISYYIDGGMREMVAKCRFSLRQRILLALAAAGLFYYVFNYIVAFTMERAERSLAYYQ